MAEAVASPIASPEASAHAQDAAPLEHLTQNLGGGATERLGAEDEPASPFDLAAAGEAGAKIGATAEREKEGTYSQDLLRPPATDKFRASFSQSNTTQEHKKKLKLLGIGAGLVEQIVRGMSVAVKPESDDYVLLVVNAILSVDMHAEGSYWHLCRGGARIGPAFHTHTEEIGRGLDYSVFIPWVDRPGKRMDTEYNVGTRTQASFYISREGQIRQLAALVIPKDLLTTARRKGEGAAQTVGLGGWFDVDGLTQITVMNPGEKVLVICAIRYVASWCSEYNRGRFTITRDGADLDPQGYGLQAVRACFAGGPGNQKLGRLAVMTLIDDPGPGVHSYTAKAGVTLGDDEDQAGALLLEEDDRQLSLLRLPSSAIAGPACCSGLVVIDEDRWTEIPGLEVNVSVRNKWDRVLLVYHVNFNPTELVYEAMFTLLRSSARGVQNLGHEEKGLWAVSSDYRASSEYPHAMLFDQPGVGIFTYNVVVRCKRIGLALQPVPVEVGPDGQLAAAVLPLHSAR